MVPWNAYKDMLDIVVSPIACVNMNHQIQLEQMENGAMFATGKAWRAHQQALRMIYGSWEDAFERFLLC
jgi:hypothetical protein